MIMQIDVMRGLAGVANESVACVISDPPYSAGGNTERAKAAADPMVKGEKLGWIIGDDIGTAGLAHLMREVAVESLRILKPGGSLLTFMDWRMIPIVAPAISSAGLKYANLVIWNKQTPGMGEGFRAQHETILHHTKGTGIYHNRATGNVISGPRTLAQNRIHPTEKPRYLIATLLDVTTTEGDTVLDIFAGSGVVGQACAESGRKYLGFDLDPKYANAANQRLDQLIKPSHLGYAKGYNDDAAQNRKPPPSPFTI